MSYTIGTALLDARDNKLRVELLVEGHWIQGAVEAVDGFGVVLSREAAQHSVIRIESIAAINVDEGGHAIPTQRQDATGTASRHVALAH